MRLGLPTAYLYICLFLCVGTRVVGITGKFIFLKKIILGGICSGKSTVAGFFKEKYDVGVIDTNEIVDTSNNLKIYK